MTADTVELGRALDWPQQHCWASQTSASGPPAPSFCERASVSLSVVSGWLHCLLQTLVFLLLLSHASLLFQCQQTGALRHLCACSFLFPSQTEPPCSAILEPDSQSAHPPALLTLAKLLPCLLTLCFTRSAVTCSPHPSKTTVGKSRSIQMAGAGN